jgi:glycogen(starch) synthase
MPASYLPVVGGLQNVTHALARGFQTHGHDVQVVTNRYPTSLSPHEMMEGVSVRRLHFLKSSIEDIRRKRFDLFFASLYCSPATNNALGRLMESFRPDVVNVHYPDGQIPFVLRLRERFDFRLVVSLHGYDVERFTNSSTVNGSSQQGFDSFITLLNQADCVTACSQYLLDKIVKLESSVLRKASVIHNGIDPLRFQTKAKYSHPRPYVLAFGRLTHAKGFDLLLEAFGRIASTAGEPDLVIAGDGELRECLEHQVEKLNLRGRVHFIGSQTPDQIVELLNASLFVVVPSRAEAFGIAALEGMAAGKPVLATRVGGLPEFLPESGNKIVEPTVEGLTAGMNEWLAGREELPRGPSNRKKAANYTWARTVKLYLQVYQASVAEKAAAGSTQMGRGAEMKRQDFIPDAKENLRLACVKR